MPVVPAEPVVTAASFFFCWRAMGAASIRHSLRPLRLRRVTPCKARAFLPRERERITLRLRRRAAGRLWQPPNRSCEHDIFSPDRAIANFAAHHMIGIM